MASVGIYRRIGGLGDLIQMRGLFANLRRQYDQIEFCCPKKFHDALADHPFVDKLTDSGHSQAKRNDAWFDLTWPCHKEEMEKLKGIDRSRLEIWADVCGVELLDTDYHFVFTPQEGEIISNLRNAERPLIVLQPRSAARSKSIIESQQVALVTALAKAGAMVYVAHTQPLPHLDDYPCTVLNDLSLRAWLCLLAGADCVVTVDTSAFHARGGLGGPMVCLAGPTHCLISGQWYDGEIVQIAQDLECRGPCHDWRSCPLTSHIDRPCMTGIDTDLIVDAVFSSLEQETQQRWSIGLPVSEVANG